MKDEELETGADAPEEEHEEEEEESPGRRKATRKAKKTAWFATLATAGLVAAQWKSVWEGIEGTMTWVVENLGDILARDQVQAVLVAVALATFVGSTLPKYMNKNWTPTRTTNIVALISGIVAFSTAWYMVFTQNGFVYALLAGFAGPKVSEQLRDFWYWLKPKAKPESLKE